MSLSIYNSTITPLDSGETFTGSVYDNILDFAEINISILCDVGYTINYIYSQDKVNVNFTNTEVVPMSATTNFFRISVLDRYFKLQIIASDGTMAILNVQTIYKSVITYSDAGSGVDVNVTNAFIPASQYGTWTVDVATLPGTIDVSISSQTAGLALDSSLTAINNTLTSQGHNLLWNSATVIAGGHSTYASPNGGSTTKCLTVFGNTDTSNTIITLQCSNNGTTFFDTQYTYTQPLAGDFGYALTLPFNYVRLKSVNAINSITAHVTYS